MLLLLQQASAPKGVEVVWWPPKPRSHLSDGWLLLLMHSAQPPCVQEFAWLHDRPPCRNSLTGVPGGGLEGKNMRVCGGALRRREKNYTCANNAYVHVVVCGQRRDCSWTRIGGPTGLYAAQYKKEPLK